MKFNGASGRKPSAEARRYIYRMLAMSLEEKLSDGTGNPYDDDGLDELDRRRIQRVGDLVVRELRRKAAT